MRRGQTLVEFAISISLLILLLVGLIELGRYVFTIGTLTNAVREGARYAIVRPFDTDGIVERVRQTVSGIDRPAVAVQVTFNPPTRASGSIVTITASYPFQSIIGIFNRTIQVSTVMRMP